MIAQAFKKFVYGNEKRRAKPSLREKLKCCMEAVQQAKNRERSRMKKKEKEQSL